MEWIASLIVGIITAGAALFGTISANKKTEALIQYRMDQLEKQVNKLLPLSERVALLERETKTLWKQIDEIRKEMSENE